MGDNMKNIKELKYKIETEINMKMYETASKLSHEKSIFRGVEAEYEYSKKVLLIAEENLKNATSENKEEREKDYQNCWLKMSRLHQKYADATASVLSHQIEYDKKLAEVSTEVCEKYQQEFVESEA